MTGLLHIAAALKHLFHMGMIGNMVLTVAMVAVAFGAIAEFQFRVGHVGATADSAFMMIGRFDLCVGGFIGTGIGERNGAGAGLRLLRRIALFLFEKPGCVGTPGQREYIFNIRTEEQEIIGQGHQGEEIIGEIKIRN